TRRTPRSEGEEESGTEGIDKESQPLHVSGICKWFNVHMGFGFLSMTAKGGAALRSSLDVFVHQSKLHVEGFHSLKEGGAVNFTFKKSSKGLESIWETNPRGNFCISSERRPKGKSLQKCYNCGGLDHHAKECKLPPQPKKCHFCQSISHMVANCPVRAQQSPSLQGKPAYLQEEEDMHSSRDAWLYELQGAEGIQQQGEGQQLEVQENGEGRQQREGPESCCRISDSPKDAISAVGLLQKLS
uniref:Protein lin-28 homolog A n=1 Tax=Malurus cyaneus samueli TaxID=2593467 RepID=A0A8C5T4B3_9PASS